MSTSNISPPTVASQKALAYLKAAKPNDGWAIQATTTTDDNNKKMIMLLRRNVPVSDTSFLDIHYDIKQQVVVGVLTDDGSTCQVLVDAQTKKPVSQVRIVSCESSYQYAAAAAATATSSGTSRRNPAANADRTTPTSNNNNNDLSSQEKQLLEGYVKNALIAVAAVIALKVLFSTMLVVVVLPLLYGYLYSTCPTMDSFDAKQQLKRVLRGYHLPDAHPQKPKGLLQEWTSRIAATVTTELATLPGYTVEMWPVLPQAVIWTSMSVPTANLQCYWVGANHQWYYVGSRELTTDQDATTPTIRPHYD